MSISIIKKRKPPKTKEERSSSRKLWLAIVAWMLLIASQLMNSVISIAVDKSAAAIEKKIEQLLRIQQEQEKEIKHLKDSFKAMHL